MAFSLFLLRIFQFYCVLCGKTSRRNCKIHGRNSRQFFLAIFRPVVYSAAKHSGETAQYRDGTLANFLVAFSGLLCTLCHFVPLGHGKMMKRASKKHQNGSLGGLGEALEGLGGPSTISYGKWNLKSGSLTPSATFFGTPFWTLFEPWAHFFHECSRFWLKNSSDLGCAEFWTVFLPFSDVIPKPKTF